MQEMWVRSLGQEDALEKEHGVAESDTTEQLINSKVGEVGESLPEERRPPRLPVPNTWKA